MESAKTLLLTMWIFTLLDVLIMLKMFNGTLSNSNLNKLKKKVIKNRFIFFNWFLLLSLGLCFTIYPLPSILFQF